MEGLDLPHLPLSDDAHHAPHGQPSILRKFGDGSGAQQVFGPADPQQPALQTRESVVLRWRAVRAIYAVARAIYPAGGKRILVKRLRFLVRALHSFSIWQHWYMFLQSSPFGAIARYYPRLYEKPFRPYLHMDLTHTECHRILREHYLFLRRQAPAGFVAAILGNKPFLLNEDSVDDLREPLILNLTYAKHMQQEGELTLSIGRPDSVYMHAEHQWIASLTFVVQYGAAGWEILIGGVQGGHAGKSKEDIKFATHVFHGLRPKHFLVYILREVAAAWGVSRIYAISDAAHCFMRRRYRDRVYKMKSSYDALWRDVGGRLAAHGFYLIPAGNPQRLIQTVPSRKRAQYLRRFAMLDSIKSEIHAKLATAGKS